MLSASDLKGLAQLLRVEENESSSDEDLPRTGYTKMGPGDIGKKIKVKITGNDTVPVKEEADTSDPKCIWSLDEVPEVPVTDDAVWDPRDSPQYQITYRQAVRSEDIFLQMSNKTPATASCECMVITISMDGESKDAVDCNITKTTLDIRSPKYRLCLPFPHPVDPSLCNAEWDSTTSKLTVNLQLKREFDFINF